MKELTEDVLREATSLIDQLRSGELGEEELSAIAVRLDQLLLDPNWFDYAVDHMPELSSEEVVRKAYSYRRIVL